MEPILKAELPAKLSDGVEIIIKGEVFSHPIFPSGEMVFNRIRLINKLHSFCVGEIYYKEPFNLPELEEKLKFVADDPEVWLYPVFRKTEN